jgi:hypothetical protein
MSANAKAIRSRGRRVRMMRHSTGTAAQTPRGAECKWQDTRIETPFVDA